MVLHQHDRLQNIHRLLPPPNHCPKDGRLDHLRRHDDHRLYRRRLLLCHPLSVPAHLLLLEQGPEGHMHQRRGHHRPHLPIQRL